MFHCCMHQVSLIIPVSEGKVTKSAVARGAGGAVAVQKEKVYPPTDHGSDEIDRLTFHHLEIECILHFVY